MSYKIGSLGAYRILLSMIHLTWYFVELSLIWDFNDFNDNDTTYAKVGN